jgi:hypothetical protein
MKNVTQIKLMVPPFPAKAKKVTKKGLIAMAFFNTLRLKCHLPLNWHIRYAAAKKE